MWGYIPGDGIVRSAMKPESNRVRDNHSGISVSILNVLYIYTSPFQIAIFTLDMY